MLPSCLGPWEGVGKNTYDPTPWTIAVNLTAAESGGACGTIEYPSLGCGGTLEHCEITDGVIRATELYTHGQQFCAPEGTVTFHCGTGEVQWQWDSPLDHVASTLHRPGDYHGPAPVDAAPSPAPAPAPVAPIDAAIVKDKPRDKGCACHAGGDAITTALPVALALAWITIRSCAWPGARARGSRAAADRSAPPPSSAPRDPAPRGSAPSARSRRRPDRRSGR